MKEDYFDKAIEYGNMRKALKKCCRNVRWKDSVIGYELHAPQNTIRLIESLKNGTYRISPYQRFVIHEPKKRDIVATRIADRQVQMALCLAGLYDDITEHFIYDNCACQKGKGTDFALKRMKVHMLRYYREHGQKGWVLNCDIRHFFPETRHDVAKAAVEKRVGDENAKRMVMDIIDSFEGDYGIGLGSQISQLTELAVLDDIDHMIKERLRVKHYIRYMDDFILIHDSREYLEECLEKIRDELEKIGLRLNDKTTIYPIAYGIRFLQWRFVLTDSGGVRMHMSSRKTGRERRRLKKLVIGEANGRLAPGTADNSERAWEANAKRGDAFYKQKRMRQYLKEQKEMNSNDGAGTDTENGARRMACEKPGGTERSKRGLYCHDGRHRNSY